MNNPSRVARTALICVAALVGMARPVAAQQCGTPTGSFNNWVTVRLCELAATTAPPEAQAEAPSASSGSTALVERANAPDIFSLALGLAGVGTNDGEDETATTMTVSAFAVRASATGDNPLDPAVYQRGRAWRRWSFSAGRTASAGAETPDGRLFGIKYLPLDERDVSDRANAERFEQLSGILQKQGLASGTAFHDAVTFIAQALTPAGTPLRGAAAFAAANLGSATFEQTLEKLTDSQRTALDEVLMKHALATPELRTELDALVQSIRRAPQLALTYQTILRSNDGDDEHHFGVAYDMGMGTRMSAIVNGGLIVIDRALTDATTAARVAGELQFDVRRLATMQDALAARGHEPITLSVAGLGEWHSDDGPKIAKVQFKVTVPLPGPLAGLDVPVSVTLANRTELVDEMELRGNVGFTVDLSKVQNVLRALRR